MNDESMRLTLGVTKALSDIQRLRILMMLRPGELCVCQIIAVLGLAPSTVSKHLSILANARLVDSRKDGRWAYYRLASLADTHAPLDWLATSLRQDGQIRVDQEKLAAINACDPQSIARRQRVSDKIAMTVRRGAPGGRALPELREKNAPSGRAGSPSTPNDGGDTENTLQKKIKEEVTMNEKAKVKILFLCTGNSCRSQMAEGWARALKGDVIEAYSAGIETHGLNLSAVKVMAEAGVDISGHRSKLLESLSDVPFDYVVTVCDNAHESCPIFPRRTKVAHVGFDDPPRLAKDCATEEEKLNCYRRVRDEIKAFVETLPESFSRQGAKE